MKLILRRIESLAGLAVASDETLEVERITLGRGTDQTVQLPDIRVTLRHAEIHRDGGMAGGAAERGACRIKCHGENPVWVNGHPVLEAALRPGDALNFGRFRVRVCEPPPGSDLLLEVSEHLSARQAQTARKQRVRLSLAAAGLGKRRAAWALALIVLVAGLILPIVLRYGGAEGQSLDRLWQAGESSTAHSAFVQDCAVCHQQPFARVRNDACLACHQQQPHHSDRPELLTLNGMANMDCGDCHREHSGPGNLITRSDSLCTTCHANPDDDYALAQLPPVSDFEQNHPDSTLSLPTPQTAGAAAPREESGLHFPHDLHVAEKGISSPDGKKVLVCADCHRPAGAGFAPVRMQGDCIACHRLDFDPDHPVRRLPHAAPEEVADIIRDHFARLALAGDVQEQNAPDELRLRRRPGEALTPAQSAQALAWADAQAVRHMEEVFERRVCRECHQVQRATTTPPSWTIAPVSLNASFLTGARFDHKAHASEDCGRCHQAQTSKTSADVLIPTIATCRECHGDPGASGKVGSTCVDCHGFHISGKTMFETKP